MGQVERNKRTTWLQFFWVVSDLLAILLGMVAGYFLRFHSALAAWVPPAGPIPPFDIYLLAAVVTVIVWVPLFYALGLYRIERGRARHRRGDLVRGFVLGALVLAAVGFFYRGASFSRVGMVLTWLLTSGFVILGRSLVHLARRRVSQLIPIRFAVVGDGPLVPRLVESLVRSSYPHDCVGLLTTRPAPEVGVESVLGSASETAAAAPSGPGRTAGGPGIDGGVSVSSRGEAPPRVPSRTVEGPGTDGTLLAVLGPLERLVELGTRHQLDLVVVAAGSGSPPDLERAFLLCQRLDLDFQFVPDVFSLWGRSVKVEDIDGLPLLRLRDIRLGGWNGVMKRTFDIAVSVPLLVLLTPVFVVLGVAVKVTSPGPVFHSQERVGRDRRPFRMIKFRSMRADAESETGPVWAQANDPRRTAVGAFLRRWSLDELPQLWNVCVGDMSLVGPRPERPVFVEEFESSVHDYYDRHRVKSGVTGWAQVHGLRGSVPIEHRTAYDLYYVENWSLWLDLRILWMTVSTVFRHRGE